MKLLTRVFSTLWLLLMLTYSINAQNYQDNWESLKQYRIPEWFCDAKFGIFIHWGVYSVPAFGSEWYPRNMYLSTSPEFKHHRDKYGDQSKFGYKDFIPMFKAERWNPKAWAELFKKAGAKYVVPVAEHHDGFAMYATKYSRWNAVRIGGEGQFPPNYSSAYNIKRKYVVPSEAIRYGARNTIAIKIFDMYGEGGVTNGPMGGIELIKK